MLLPLSSALIVYAAASLPPTATNRDSKFTGEVLLPSVESSAQRYSSYRTRQS